MSRRGLGYLDPGRPVNWAHPLNRGLVGWWAVPPNSGWRGGLTLRDLVRGGRKPGDGTLTNGPTWVGGPPGGYGALSFDGSNDHVLATADGVGTSSNTCTMSAWVYPRTKASFRPIFENRTGGVLKGLLLGSAAGNPFAFSWDDSGTEYGGAVTGIASQTGCWNWVCAAVSAGGVYMAGWDPVNGWKTYSDSNANAARDATGTWSMGKDTVNLLFWDGLIGDVRLHSNALSAAFVRALFEQTRRGHPDTLRWLGQRAWFPPPAAAGTTASGDGSSAGTSTASGVGASLAASAGSSAGTGSASGVGASLAASAGASAGTAAASGVGASATAAAGSAAGTGDAAGAGASTASSAGSSAGVGAASGTGAALAASAGSADGTSSASGVSPGGTTAAGAGSASGSSSASGVGASLAAAAGSAAGTSVASGHSPDSAPVIDATLEFTHVRDAALEFTHTHDGTLEF